MKAVSAFLCFILLSCCTVYRPRRTVQPSGHFGVVEQSQTECDRLNSRVRFWGAAAVFSAAVTGSNGVGVAAADLKDNQAARLGLGITVAAFTALGAVSAYLATDYAKSRERLCEEVK